MNEISDRFRGLSPEKRALLARGLKARRTPAIPKRAPNGPAPLSFAQERLWFLHEATPELTAYNIPRVYRLRGELNVAALQRALYFLVERHETLRTIYRFEGGDPVQIVAPPQGLSLPLTSLENMPAAGRDAECDRIANAERARPFDLGSETALRARLIRLAPCDHVLLMVVHHIAMDDQSRGVFARELAALYSAFAAGRPSPLSPLPIQYADFAVWQRQWLQGEEIAKRVAHWKAQLEGASALLTLPADRPRPATLSFRGRRYLRLVPPELAQAVRDLGARERATMFMTLLAAFKILLHRFTSQDDLVVGAPVANRDLPEIEPLIGFFSNTLALRTSLAGDPSFCEVLSRVRQTALDAYDHHDLPFEKLVAELKPERNLSHSPLFQIMFVHRNASADTPALAGLETEVVEVEPGTSKFDLQLAATEDPQGLRLAWDYSTDLFDPATIERAHSHFLTLLKGIVANPGLPISRLPLLSEEERRLIVTGWNRTETPFRPDRCLHELIEEQVDRTPDATAVSFEGIGISYRELEARANRLANLLRQRGCGPDKLVGVAMERSIEMVVALLGTLKAGAAYVPIDPALPLERQRLMIEETRTPVLLTQNHLGPHLPPTDAEIICLDSDWPRIECESGQRSSSGCQPHHLAYVIYTSGSTGKPKGAMLEHRGVVNRLLWMQEAYRLTPAGRVLQKTPYSFDVSVWEFFWPLMTGARLVMAKPDGHQDAAYLVRTILAEGITTLHFVPSMLEIFLHEPGLDRCRSVRQVFCSGEALSTELEKAFFARMTAALHNLYGPTEASVDVTYFECRPGSARAAVPIGRPVANTQIYILDRSLQPVPIGVPGELHIGGVQVARGYLGRPELTAEKFIRDPFSDDPEARLYKTGDLARFLADGQIEYLGRLDHQVKIRGFRIELGEIEAALNACPGVREAVVIARDNRLIAYALAAPGAAPTTSGLHRFLKRRLPEYMIPAAFVTLEAFPLTSSGKVDRSKLPAPPQERPLLAGGYVAPGSPVEETLAVIWRATFRLDRVGVHDDFFELGGNSLLSAQLTWRLREAFRLQVPMRKLFECPTISELAAYITAEMLGAGSADELAALLDEVEKA